MSDLAYHYSKINQNANSEMGRKAGFGWPFSVESSHEMMYTSSMSSSRNPTIPASRATGRKKSKKKDDGKYFISRKNCFGMTEQLDPLSVEEAIEGEDEANSILDTFLDGIARHGTTRAMKKITKKQEQDRKISLTPPRSRAVTQPKLKKAAPKKG